MDPRVTYTYRVILEPDPDGGFVVTVPALPGCVTWGRDSSHALEMAHEAIEGFLETLADLGEAIPSSDAAQPFPMGAVVEVTTPPART